jgi:hypothetical protein
VRDCEATLGRKRGEIGIIEKEVKAGGVLRTTTPPTLLFPLLLHVCVYQHSHLR